MQCAGGAAMTDPITPPPELVAEWLKQFYGPALGRPLAPGEASLHVATAAAQWGADQELEACCAEVSWFTADKLRAARRPKPQSLKEQALGAMGRFTVNAHTNADEMNRDFDTIRRALEQLND